MQNAGAKAAGTGLQKSAVVQKIALSQVSAALQGLSGGQGIRNVSGQVDVDVVNGTQQIVNPNGTYPPYPFELATACLGR